MQTRWNTFNKFQKIMLYLLAAMVVLFAILTGFSRGRLGVYFHDSLLEMQGAVENAAYTGKSHGEDVSIVVGQDSETAVGVSFVIGDIVNDHCLVEYPLESIQTEDGWKPGLRVSRNGHVLFEGAYEPGSYSESIGYLLYDQTGQRTIAFTFGHTYGGGNGYWGYYKPDVGEILYFANGPELTARGDWAYYALATLFVLLTALETAFPYELFQLGHALRPYVKDPEPTDFYYQMNRFGNVVFALLALATYIMALRALPAP